MFACFCYSSCDEKQRAESSTIVVNGEYANTVLHWANADLVLDNFEIGYNNLWFEIVLQSLAGDILLYRESIPSRALHFYDLGEIQKDHRLSLRGYRPHVFDIANISILYVAYRYMDYTKANPGGIERGQLRVSEIRVRSDRTTPREKTNRGDKYTCVCNGIYLGRIQEHRTQKRFRLLSWMCPATRTEQAFEGISPRAVSDFELLAEDNIDRARSREGSGDIPPVRDFVPDNDAFSNPVVRLPIFMKEGEPLVLQFYNLSDSSPRPLEVRFGPEDFDFDNVVPVAVDNSHAAGRRVRVVYSRNRLLKITLELES